MGISEVISLLSGIALFLFGMTLMGDGLKRVSGNKLEPILFRLAGTPIRAMLLGTFVTAVIQSSSATSVMVVGFVNSGMMKMKQAIRVILGAILGTSITGWIICLSYIDSGSGIQSILSTSTLTGVIAVVGIIFRMFCKKKIHHHIGDIMMGFAVLMFGMSNMSSAVSSLGTQPWFTSLLTSMTHPIMGILIGLVFSALLQSASAAVGIIQALSLTGAITLESGLPLLMGIAIGASVPVLLSALGANVNGRKTAVSYLVASFMGVMVCSSLFYIGDAIFHFSFLSQTVNPVTIALVNTILRFSILLVLAPFVDVLEAVANLVVPTKNEPNDPALKLEERFLTHPALAIEQSKATISDMARDAEKSVEAASGLISNFSEEGFTHVEDLETAGDRYEDALGSYLAKLTGVELTERQNCEISKFLHTLSDFERISDHAVSIARSAQEIHDKNLTFTDDAKKELAILISAVRDNLHNTITAFINEDIAMAQRVEPLEEVIDSLCDEMKMRHVDRVQQGQCTIEHGFVFNDLITCMERISDHCSNIAVALIELSTGSFDTHMYLGRIKEKRSPDFERYIQDYTAKYSFD